MVLTDISYGKGERRGIRARERRNMSEREEEEEEEE